MARRGDVALARFPFTNLSGAKLRPVLVIAEAPGPHRDYIVLFISSQQQSAAAAPAAPAMAPAMAPAPKK